MGFVAVSLLNSAAPLDHGWRESFRDTATMSCASAYRSRTAHFARQFKNQLVFRLSRYFSSMRPGDPMML
jgi:hypothetical protein